MKVSNRGCIGRLSLRALRANRTRNLVAVLAIALTAMLFTSLFTIALSINEGIQQSTFRQVGGYAHGSFKYLSREQLDELKDDPLIQEHGERLFLGMPQKAPFQKSHVELSYMSAETARWMYSEPTEGRLPEEGTDEAAAETHVLDLLGVPHEPGAQFTMTFDVDGYETTQTFTLSGWWTGDEISTASQVLLPESRVHAVLDEIGYHPVPGRLNGTWGMDVMLKSGTRHIEADLNEILSHYGYQSEDEREENYIGTGVNWAYTGAQLSSSADALTIGIIVGVLLLILFTGYLIIYNVFQISVAGDIRFYGLLKTIGTTPRQLRRIVRIQALLLSAAGIPLGLLVGWLTGIRLVPVIVAQLSAVVVVASVSPVLFLGSAAFALATVLISCRRPARMAARVSPIEAVRYTEGGNLKRKGLRRSKGVSLFSMALANLGRSRGKTVVTMLSLTLAVVLLNMTATLSNSFDIDKYISNFTASDFIIGGAGRFKLFLPFSNDSAVSEEAIEAVQAQGGITDGGRIYGATSQMLEFVPESYFRQTQGGWYDPEGLEMALKWVERNDKGEVGTRVQISGMEPFALDHLEVFEGDLDKLKQSGEDKRYIAAVYLDNDYGEILPDSHWAKLGDTVTIRYIDESELYYRDTGEVIPEGETISETRPYDSRAVKYRDIEYEVAALVNVPYAMAYRYYGADEFVMNAEDFIRDTGTDSIMYYAFDTTDEAAAPMEAFLKDYTGKQNADLDYESKGSYTDEFDSTRSMFVLLGGALSFIVGLVGVLNFFNAIVTGIASRRRELAVLQSIGMTDRQLKGMLMLEGVLYTVGAAVLALLIIVVSAPIMGSVLEGWMWFLTYRFTVWPVAVIVPLFMLLGILIPMQSSRAAQKFSVVERLRTE